MPIRIISGDKRGLRLHLPKDPSFRPTQAKVREAVFSMLQGKERDARVLDLYAGSGSMGFEAISRGASFCLFCEDSDEALEVLSKNVALFPKRRKDLETMRLNLPQELRQISFREPFDLIFMDPPYKL
ncbi:MAG: RsmD family RNA methyltransferase, partial [Deltaproteobacteria bacterium]|nr:RsmD family RNA methyltransferase [Deltaproteobacteria bacterium]